MEKVASDIEKLLAKKRKALDVSSPEYKTVLMSLTVLCYRMCCLFSNAKLFNANETKL